MVRLVGGFSICLRRCVDCTLPPSCVVKGHPGAKLDVLSDCAESSAVFVDVLLGYSVTGIGRDMRCRFCGVVPVVMF